MEDKSNKKDSPMPSGGRWSLYSTTDGTLRELKESTAKLKSEVKKESTIFSKYALTDGGQFKIPE